MTPEIKTLIEIEKLTAQMTLIYQILGANGSMIRQVAQDKMRKQAANLEEDIAQKQMKLAKKLLKKSGYK